MRLSPATIQYRFIQTASGHQGVAWWDRINTWHLETWRFLLARSLSDSGLIYCAGGRAAHSFPIFRCIEPLCASISSTSVLALPPCSLRSPESDRRLASKNLHVSRCHVIDSISSCDIMMTGYRLYKRYWILAGESLMTARRELIQNGEMLYYYLNNNILFLISLYWLW